MPPNPAIAPSERPSAHRGPDGEELDFELLDSDGVPVETVQHRLQINLLMELTDRVMADQGRTEYFAAGDVFLYYSVEQARFIAENAPALGELPSPGYRKALGPDFFIVDGAPWREGRQMWIVWEEDHVYPQFVVEVTSPSTAKIDRTVKKQRYEKLFRTAEYYMYKPATDRLQAYHLAPTGRYRKAVDKRVPRGAQTASDRWVWSEHLGVWLGLWEGRYARFRSLWLRFYDADGRLILTERERAEAEKNRAEAEKNRAEAEKSRAEAEKNRAEAEKNRAEAEKNRADAAEAEIARLRALLAGDDDAGP